MSESKRRRNEFQFKNWVETETGGRIYWFEVQGKWGWKARCVKEVDNEENTLAFRQEIFDDKGVLKEIHEKYPVDEGHTKLN